MPDQTETFTRCEHVTAKPRGYTSRNSVRCRKDATHEVYAPFSGIIHAQRCEQHAREMAARYFDKDEIEVRPITREEK